MNTCHTKEYIKNCKEVKAKFVVSELISREELDIIDLPSNYKAVLEKYRTGKHTWNYCKLKLYTTNKTLEIFSNYHTCNVCCVQSNKTAYLLVSENYQGLTAYNLDSSTSSTYIEEAWQSGNAWCPADILRYDDEKRDLYILGGYWGCDMSLRIFHNVDLNDLSLEDYTEE